ncbi:hypothetical protein AAGV28_07065 [Flavobacterium sp. FZUC8N2.13]|uniref:Uncharacterized protein n=1 Tax=Flavobacterium zubiriense TaxID=3138075 RepID=A0ABV4TAJ7_9FLAO
MDTLTILYSIAVLALICAVFLAVSGVRCGGRTIPEPPEHLRPKGSVPKMRNPPKPPTKCICNNIKNHSPGGRCEVCYKKNSMPIYENPPMPPAISAESMRLSLENSRKADKAYKKMIAQLEDAQEAEINYKSRKKFNELTLTLSPENMKKYLDALELKK